MSAAVFDTLKASRKLQDAGISKPHAEAIVCSMADAFSDTVATKADLAKLEATMYKLAAGIIVAVPALTVTLLRLLAEPPAN